MNEKVTSILTMIMEKFQDRELPQAIAYSLFPMPNIPSANWSYLNRLIMLLSGTSDARGIRQWNKAGRKVVQGAKAIYILVPLMKKVEISRDDCEDVEFGIIRGFLAKPVFRVEDTDGDPVEYDQEIKLPDLPLMEKAMEWGIKVIPIHTKSNILGAYRNASKEILLATPEEHVFFHELSHAAHWRVCEHNDHPTWYKEVVAELSAQTLCRLVGKQSRDSLGNSYHYIKHYGKDVGLSPINACLKALDDTRRVLTLILDL